MLFMRVPSWASPPRFTLMHSSGRFFDELLILLQEIALMLSWMRGQCLSAMDYLHSDHRRLARVPQVTPDSAGNSAVKRSSSDKHSIEGRLTREVV